MDDIYNEDIDESGENDLSDGLSPGGFSRKSTIIASKGISPELQEIDRELEQLIKNQNAKIKVIGVGGGGNNSLSRMREIGIRGGELIAINTDAQDLLYANADQKILIGRELTAGLGAGSNPKVGEEAAKESVTEIKKKISGADMVFITCGLGEEQVQEQLQ